MGNGGSVYLPTFYGSRTNQWDWTTATQEFHIQGEALIDDLWELKIDKGHQFGSSGIETEGYNKEVGKISDYAFGKLI